MSIIDSLITSEDCANCRLCCWFTRYDIWETPVINDDLRGIISKRYPETKFVSRESGGSLFVMTESPQTDPKYRYQPERYNCPMLDENGCKLSNEKPFECQIWPFRIMSQEGKLLISLSLLCKPILENSFSSIIGLLENWLAEVITEYAKLHPSIIKEYTDGYPILMYIK
ncbi:MAG: YkgJ family cysteine cluster protein [Ruminococcus sp.]|jgi:Fe-S-cluster containining protein|nr:YkgJ family cysteine cluster protein [Ruminococcus sp.]